MIFYKLINTKIGKIGIVWRQKNDITIVQIILPSVLNSIRENYPRIKLGTNKIIQKIAQDIRAYIDGKMVIFSLNNLDLNQLGKFQKRVLMLVGKIPRGKVSTYGEIAKKLKIPKGARAVGQALAKNPFPIIIPCHRVIKSDGSLGGFSGGGKVKKKLLNIEGLKV